MSKVIGNRYLIVKEIGSGGMADVYLAMDSVLNREVALKVLRGSLSSDPVALLRFQREARAISALSHPNVVEVYDVGEDKGQHYIVMEMVRGTTLKELIHRRGALDTTEAVSIMKQLASAVAKAHEEQVIHRDIKPQNILIKDDGTVKITDFGIALAGDAIQLTKQDSVMGSVHYMAPELSRGEGASFQSDIYALGTVFYELLTGDVPYRGENPVEIAMKHLRDPFPRVQRYNRQVPNSIANIITKSTQKVRALRYAHMDGMIDDLQHCLDDDVRNEPLWTPAELELDQQSTKMFDRVTTADTTPVKKKAYKVYVAIGVLLVVALVVGWFVLRPAKPKELHVPDVIGQSVDVASSQLTQMGLFVSASISYEYSDEFDTGKVIAVRPGVDSLVEPASQIRLTVSSGLNFTIDDYKGKTQEEVRSILAGKNVTIHIKNEFKKDSPVGIVLRQEGLVKGDKINPETRREITLIVSSKMDFLIPSTIIGRSVATVQAELIEQGVRVQTEVLSQAGMSPSEIATLNYNVVVRSNPTPGSYYVQDDTSKITLYYYEKATAKPTEANPDNGSNSNGSGQGETPQKPTTNPGNGGN